MNLKVHLVFPGTCEQAFGFYKETLDGKIAFLFRKKEDKTMKVCEKDKEKISHIVLKTAHFELGGEDANLDVAVVTGNNNKLVLVFTCLDKCKHVFSQLSEGGKIIVPLEKTFFCDALGEVIDQFGIHWLVMMSDDDYEA